MKNMAQRQQRAQREQMHLYEDTFCLWNIKSLFLRWSLWRSSSNVNGAI